MGAPGFNVIENRYLPTKAPTLKLSASVPVSDAFRAEMNAWLLEMFGERHVVYFLGDAGLGGHPMMCAGPQVLAMLTGIRP